MVGADGLVQIIVEGVPMFGGDVNDAASGAKAVGMHDQQRAVNDHTIHQLKFQGHRFPRD